MVFSDKGHKEHRVFKSAEHFVLFVFFVAKKEKCV